jgi:CubicO group peptidase (beta-lactamase class C family)
MTVKRTPRTGLVVWVVGLLLLVHLPNTVAAQGGGAAAEEWPAMIRAFVDERAQQGLFSGTVAVGRHGVPLFVGAWGLADAATGRAMTPETPVNLGSMNKMFTGLALAQLVAKGRLVFSDTVGEFLPGYPNATVRREVTLHQLLTHTAGIPSYWNAAYEASRDTLRSLAGFAATFNREPLLFAPGTSWQYSNGGPVIAGRVLEAVTGASYFDHVRQHLYAPAGMTHTDHYLTVDTVANVAVGYGAIVDGTPRDPNTAELGLMGSSAGGGYSTVLDLVRFAGALSSGALLPPEALATVWSPPKTGAEHDRYGYLWGNGTKAGQRWVGHNGGGPGISADFRYFPESGYVVVVLSNLSEAAMPVSAWIVNLVAGGIGAADRRASADSTAVREAALDYIEGWFTGDAPRMTRALHPELVKRRVASDRLEDMTRDRLTRMAAMMAGGTVPPGLADGVRILDMTESSAIVRLDAPGWIDWLVLARIGEGWRIVQVHWEGKADHSGRGR